MSIWFTSDFHLNHINIAGASVSQWKSGFRDFKDVSHMNETILDNVNRLVSPEDTLYFLGDFCFKDHRLTPDWRRRLYCKDIYWLRGNHDKRQDLYRDYFTWVGEVLNITVEKQPIFLSHYKHAIWEGSHKGYWHLYGHSHSSAESWIIGKSMDVGIDNAYKILGEYRPFSLEDISRIMSKRNIYFGDHHNIETNVK